MSVSQRPHAQGGMATIDERPCMTAGMNKEVYGGSSVQSRRSRIAKDQKECIVEQ